MDSHFYEADAVKAAPDLSTLASEGYPTDGSPELGTPATLPGAAWFYSLGEEIRNAIIAGGKTPDKSSVDQLGGVITDIKTALSDASDTYATKASLIARLPAGVIIPFAGTSVPSGYLLCNGALVSRTTYADLFAAVGTLYGAGDGSTTFQLPDFRDRVLQGASGTHSAGSYIAAGLPNISGNSLTAGFCVSPEAPAGAGVFRSSTWNWHGGTLVTASSTPERYGTVLSFSAADSNSFYGASTTVQPSASAIQYLIKY
ncbi:MAG: phage tail protein [Succinivibrio sp.]|nr:phage tail protein [Succinivibrio sp.]